MKRLSKRHLCKSWIKGMATKNGLLQLDQINIFYQMSSDAIQKYYDSILNDNIQPPPRLFGAPTNQVTDERRAQLSELECNVVLTILATIEAWFRLDYSSRAREKASDALSMKFRKIHKKVGLKASLKRHILKEWRNILLEDKDTISEYKGALKYRNWLAHGRYWAPAQKYDYLGAYQIAEKIKTIVPN